MSISKAAAVMTNSYHYNSRKVVEGSIIDPEGREILLNILLNSCI